MNKTFKSAIATITLSAFVFGTGSVLLPANALAASKSHHSGNHNYHHKRHEPTKISKTGVAVVGSLILGAIIVNAVQHHKDKKAREYEDAE